MTGRLGKIVTWGDVMRQMEESVRLLNSKLLADVRKLDAQDEQMLQLNALYGAESFGSRNRQSGFGRETSLPTGMMEEPSSLDASGGAAGMAEPAQGSLFSAEARSREWQW